MRLSIVLILSLFFNCAFSVNNPILIDSLLLRANKELSQNTYQTIKLARIALSNSIQSNNKAKEMESLRLIGLGYLNLAMFDSSLYYLFKSHDLSDKLNLEKDKAVNLLNIGSVFFKMNNYDEALKYYNLCNNIYNKLNDTFGKSKIENNIGLLYLKKEDFKKALEHFERSMILKQQINDSLGQAYTMGNMAIAHSNMGNYEKAIELYNKSLIIFHKAQDSIGLATNYQAIGRLFFKLKQYDLALKHYNKSLEIARNSSFNKLLVKIYNNLYELYRAKNDFRKSLEYLELYTNLNDNLTNIEKTKYVELLKVQFDTELKDREIQLLKKESDIQQIENQRQRAIRNIVLIILLFITIIVFIIFNQYIQKKRSEKKLQILNAQKDKFFSVISHDLKGAMSGLLNISETLSRNIETLDKNDLVTLSKLSYNSTLYINNLLTNLLQWAKIQTGNLHLFSETINLKLTIDDIILIYQADLLSKNIQVSNEVDENALAYIDRNLLNTVLRNLLHNAIKFTPENGKISILAEEKNGKYFIYVKDTGMGISQDEQKRLFKMDKSSSNSKSSGLGLIICYEFLNMIGENIWIESEVNKGSTFIFSVPKAIYYGSNSN